MEQEKKDKGIISGDDYLEVKDITYGAVIDAHPELDAKAVGVYWFTMACELLIGKFDMDKEIMHELIDQYDYQGVDFTNGETIH